MFRGATSHSISYLISLLQPPFGFDFKWKTITQIALPFLTLGKIREVFQWCATIKWQIMQLLDWCRSLPTALIEATCGYQLGYEILSHVWGSNNSKACVMHGDWTSYLTDKCFKRWERGLYSVHGTCYSFIQLGNCEKKILALWL